MVGFSLGAVALKAGGGAPSSCGATMSGRLATRSDKPATSFSSSFEASDPQPTWTNTAEQSSGVTGADVAVDGGLAL